MSKVLEEVEYSEVSSHLRTGITVLWQAFNTFFVMNTLLATAGGFLFSQLKHNDVVAAWGLVIVSSIGILIAIASIFTVWRFIRYLKKIMERGKAIENSNGTGIMSKLIEAGQQWNPFSAPVMTTVICIGFLVGWCFVLNFALGKI